MEWHRYRIMINEFLLPKLQDVDVNVMCLQQDSATCHNAGETMDFFKKWMGNWPPRLRDLMALDSIVMGIPEYIGIRG